MQFTYFMQLALITYIVLKCNKLFYAINLVDNMSEISEKTIVSGVKKRFQKWLGLELSNFTVQEKKETDPTKQLELTLNESDIAFLLKYSTSINTAAIIKRITEIRNKFVHGNKPFELPVIVVVPYMPDRGKQLCQQNRLSWMDLSGNAHIKEPPLYVHVEGKENQFKQRGRPASVFGSKSSLISMTFLLNPKETYTAKDLAEKTDVDHSTSSRATRRLESLGFIKQEEQKGRAKPYKLKNPFTMLSAWVEEYDFYHHEIIKGAIAETGRNNFFNRLEGSLPSFSDQFSFSGPRVAKFYRVPADSALAIVFVDSLPSKDDLERIGFKQGARGANLWVVKPDSETAFMDVRKKRGHPIVNPVQLYLDLMSIKAHRSEDLAERIEEDITENLYSKFKKELKFHGF